MNEQKIKHIINTHLKIWQELKLNKIPGQIESEMSDPNQDPTEEWRIWFPIDSKATDEEIEKVEKRIGSKLPDDYKTLLKHKHFYDLHISEASFCRHPVKTWTSKLTEMIFESYPTEYLTEKGYIPFADWSDWGLLCFDTNRGKTDNNYPIVLWDHETPDQVEDQYRNFFDLIINLDLEESINKR